MAALSRGEESAVAALYDRYSPLVYGVAVRVLRESQAAEDVLQEVFIQLWRNPAAFDCGRGDLGAWLAVIARNRAIDSLRKTKSEEELPDCVPAKTNLEDQAEREITIGKVQAVLAGIPQEQRTAIDMAFFQGLTHSEIAQRTQQPLGTIKTRIRSALMALRRAFAE
jgi:RNA polymerase sigma-70 factor, ECF subfamily